MQKNALLAPLLLALALGGGALAENATAPSPLLPSDTYTLINDDVSIIARNAFLGGAAIRLASSARAEDCVQQLCAQEPTCRAANWCPLQARPRGGRPDCGGGGAAVILTLGFLPPAASLHTLFGAPPAASTYFPRRQWWQG